MIFSDARAIECVLGIFPHPDDEAYSSAAALAQCARAGIDVTICCATRGEAGTDRTGQAQTPAALATKRTRELTAACEIIGAQTPCFLDFPDGHLAEMEATAATEPLIELIADIAPQAVITLGADGVYGASDHIALTGFVGAAVRRLELPIALLHTAFPKGHFSRLERSLRRAGVATERRHEELGMARSDASLRVAVGDLRDTKLRVLAAHASQLMNNDPQTFLSPGLVDPLLEEEWFIPAPSTSST